MGDASSLKTSDAIDPPQDRAAVDGSKLLDAKQALQHLRDFFAQSAQVAHRRSATSSHFMIEACRRAAEYQAYHHAFEMVCHFQGQLGWLPEKPADASRAVTSNNGSVAEPPNSGETDG